MNREIKFRGKRLDNEEWVYGDLLHIDGGCLIYFGSQMEVETPYIEKGSPIAVELFKTEIAVVAPDTIGQFTGLHDCNGKEIYEGDIMRIPETEFNAEIIGDVRYEKDGFVVKSRLSSWNSTLAWVCRKRQIGEPLSDIIGNVTDNSELL